MRKKVFTRKKVAKAVAREFGLREKDLVTWGGGPGDPTIQVTSRKDNKFEVVVYPDRKTMEETDIYLITQFLRAGKISEEVDLTENVVRKVAVLDSCKLENLWPWITSTCRSMVYDRRMTKKKSSEILRNKRFDGFVAEAWLQILYDVIEGTDLEGTDRESAVDEMAYHVLVAQCQPKLADLAEAILVGIGGCEGFIHTTYLDTVEGFVIDPSGDDYVEDLLKKVADERRRH